MAVMTALAIGAGVSAIGGAVGAHAAGKAAGKARRAQGRAQRELDAAKRTRATITNPYAGVKDLSGMAKDLTGQLSNPFASLGVATGAAEIQMEQADMALANTLDTLRATGSGAGGATALAQAALQSKKGVSASIEQQEAANEKLRAEGEQALQAKEMRLTEMEMSEEARIQNADAQGKAFVFGAQEQRDMATLDRMQSGIDQANTNAANANMAGAQAQAGMITGITSSVGGLMSSGAFSKGGSLNPYAGAINPATGLPF